MATYDYSSICRHVDSETKETNCQVKGSLPSWLQGVIIYNGPSLTKIGTSEYLHAFDSSSLLQKFKIGNGNVSYKSKFLQSDTYKKNQKANAITVAEFGTPGPSNKGVLSRLKDTIDSDKMMSDNAVATVVRMGSKVFGLGEQPFYFELDPESLDVIKRTNMYKAFSLATQTVHFSKDADGSYYTCAQAVGMTGPKYAIMRIPSDGNLEKAKSVASVPCRWRMSPCYIHSIAMTENYVILVEPPLAVSLMELLSDVLTNTPFIEGLHWHEDPTFFHVIDRKTWKTVSTSYVSDPFFFLHFSNVYEEANHLIIELSAYKDSKILNSMFIDKLKNGTKNFSPEFHAAFCAYLKRFVLPLNVSGAKEGQELVSLPNAVCSAKKVKKEIFLKPEDLTNIPFEHPARNLKFSGVGNRYVWGLGPDPNGCDFSQLVKLDLKTKETIVFKEEGSYPCPHLFIANPDAKTEDEGVIATLMLSRSQERLVTLLVLDARTMTEMARATAEIGATVPMALHGNFAFTA